ncbi:outer membrane protein [Sphingomonas baiyangensis]|uniref:Porin family protein n=1 Tax=Sphingomonas baiyangensis TaxID=2572576 RepID=A0A4U1L5M2_9SPHN|nr:outer membrane beta-barrel protein [Sphingomonas baiyangensis]TKD52229.1 porin family protein [Sphingomonas baiyangensis]
MRTIKASAIATVAALGLATPAIAQDANGDRHFDGPYVGGSFGFGVQPNDVGETVVFDRNLDGNFNDTIVTSGGANAFAPGFCNGNNRGSATPAGGCDNDRDAIEYFARVGWDKQFGNFVIGAMGEFGRSQVRDSVTAYSSTPAFYTFNREFDWNASIRGRVGYAAGGRTLFYAAGGPAYAQIDNSFETSNTANSFESNGGKSNSWGYTAGGGVEQKIGRNISLGLEYMYNDYVDDDYVVSVGQGTAPATNPFLLGNAAGSDLRRSDDNFRFHSIRATAALRF